MSIGRLFDISARTMQAYQAAMDVASNNISNAGNVNYTRQKVVMASEVGEKGAGNGVKIQDILRVRSEILDQQIRKYQSSFSDANKRSETLQKIESIVSEPSEQGLSNYLAQFYNSWDELSTNPTSLQLRSNVILKAQQVGEKIKNTLDGFSEVQYSLQQESTQMANEINLHLKSIYQMNQQIYDTEARGVKANELADQRDTEINELSKLVNISVSKNSSGALSINVGGIFAVDQTNYNEFDVKIINGQLSLVAKSDPNSQAILNGGELNAIADLYSNKIKSYKDKYEAWANSFVSEVNALHMQGYPLSSTGVTTKGIPFFGKLDTNGQVINAFEDDELKINSDLLNDPGMLAVSSAPNKDGDSTFANQIAGLSKSSIATLGNQTFAENYSGILSAFGMDKTVADNSTQSNELVLQNLENQRASNSGVSLDEEMTNVMKYQRSYEASAKMIKVADELMQTILNLIQ